VSLVGPHPFHCREEYEQIQQQLRAKKVEEERKREIERRWVNAKKLYYKEYKLSLNYLA
jgi:hypothetical protein